MMKNSKNLYSYKLKMVRTRRATKRSVGRGIVNSIINRLPIEMHVPGYQYCGPGTKLNKRLARGDPGINKLDAACREHDIAYARTNDLSERHLADYELEKRAWDRVKANDSSFGEKAVAYAVTNTMKAKRKIGMGFGGVLRVGRKAMRNSKDINSAANLALAAARVAIKGKQKFKTPRTIKVPKFGGVLPLIPIFAGLSALGSLAGGVSSIVRAAHEVRKNVNSNKPVKIGNALYLHPYAGKKKGGGFYLKHQKN
ncbi:uncharacterized protein LOC126909258 [Daktulosphaira vitifoliae]|uniref:uncharacterized protein LOC126909258 n=1 Tax=Daktulosphaira vitifoliae TaxID=58002 RepID=UPI0021AA96CE|nr:uncharacterized protein LOC126909258 [Daktulosphaira vitifoliae]